MFSDNYDDESASPNSLALVMENLKAPDYINWKPKSEFWKLAQFLPLIGALIVNILLPTVQKVDNLPYRIFIGLFLVTLATLYALSKYNRKVAAKLNHNAQYVFAIGVVLIIWDIATTKTGFFPLPFFPGLAQILQVMVEDYDSLIISTLYSLRLLVISFIIGAFLGLSTGVAIGWFKQWGYWAFPIIKILSVIPAVAWIPVAMYLLPSSFYAEIFLVVIAVWFPVAYMTSSGIVNIENSYFEAAKTLGAKEKFLIFKIAIPGAMPSIFTGIYTATGISFATLVVAEMVGASAGLGWYINWAKGWSNYAKVYASIIIMAIVFSLVMAVIFRIRDRCLIWQKGLLR